MANVVVECAVSNCVFHAKGNVCGAEKITVDVDRYTKGQGVEFAVEFDSWHIEKGARHSAHTCCKTFKAKNE